MLDFVGAGTFSFGDLLNQLEQFGFFQYILPFLLIFAVVYAVLTKIHVFEENKGAGVIVALAVGLLALQFDIVPAFFQVIFPNLGVGLSILLVALILAGAFISDEKASYTWIFFALGALIFFIVTFSSFSDWQFMGGYWWNQYGGLIIVLLVIIGAVVGVILASKEKGA